MTNLEWLIKEKAITGLSFVGGSGYCDMVFEHGYDWLYAEHIEKHTLNKYEHALGEALRTGWIAKDRGHYPVCFYTHEPTKVGSEWLSKQGYSMTFEALNMANPEIKFDFIRWEDEEPWSVEELLKLEVKNDCEK